jgi:hypothetical protein
MIAQLKRVTATIVESTLYKKPTTRNYYRRDYIWRTAAGNVLTVSRMKVEHIANVLECLNGVGGRKIPDPYLGRSNQRWIEIFEQELQRRK